MLDKLRPHQQDIVIKTNSPLILRDYQSKLISEVTEAFKTHDVVCLASAPNTGKTLMALSFAVNFPGQVGVSAHGQTILKNQFESRAAKFGIKVNSPESNIHVFLPQSEKRKIRKCDLLIVDEAHERYFAEEVQKIKRESGCKKVLLLTGTPSKLIASNQRYHAIEADKSNPREGKTKKYKYAEKIHTVVLPLLEVPAENMAKLNIQVADCAYNFKKSDFNNEGDLKTTVYASKMETYKSMALVLDAMHKHLVVKGEFAQLKSGFFNKMTVAVKSTAKKMVGSLGKTMIACHHASQAQDVANYFNSIGIKTLLSTALLDVDSELFEEFQKDDDAKVMVVIHRGILGYDYEKLTGFVDFTATRNPDRIYQMMMRVARINSSDVNTPKLFIKMSPPLEIDVSNIFLNLALNLMFRDFILAYNGENKNKIGVHHIVRRSQDGEREVSENVLKSTNPDERIKLPDFGDTLDIIDCMRKCAIGQNSQYVIISETNLDRVRASCGVNINDAEWNKLAILEFCRLYGERP
jgi:superfamily II DNA or RNA helicase